MRSLIGSSLCVCAMFATIVQDDQFPSPITESRGVQTERPVPPAPPAVPANRFGEDAPTPVGSVDLFGPLLRSTLDHRPLNSHDPVRQAERGLQSTIAKASKQLSSDDADTKAKAQDELKNAVGKLFDLRSKTREKQIKDLEERLAKLRKQMEQREDKKSDIIRLHIQTIVNQANGLGF